MNYGEITYIPDFFMGFEGVYSKAIELKDLGFTVTFKFNGVNVKVADFEGVEEAFYWYAGVIV